MGVPRSIDLVKTPEARQIMELAYMQQAFGRPYILPPGTPDERVAALRKAFMAARRDPELLAEAKKCASRSARCRARTSRRWSMKMYALPLEVVEKTRAALIYKPPK